MTNVENPESHKQDAENEISMLLNFLLNYL
jgi:hypothetical protein